MAKNFSWSTLADGAEQTPDQILISFMILDPEWYAKYEGSTKGVARRDQGLSKPAHCSGIVRLLDEQGYTRTAQQVVQKITRLMAAYRKADDFKNQTGQGDMDNAEATCDPEVIAQAKLTLKGIIVCLMYAAYCRLWYLLKMKPSSTATRPKSAVNKALLHFAANIEAICPYYQDLSVLFDDHQHDAPGIQDGYVWSIVHLLLLCCDDIECEHMMARIFAGPMTMCLGANPRRRTTTMET